MTTNQQLDRDEALMMLNDRVGQEVEVSVTVDVGIVSTTVMSATGKLRHWQADPGTQQTWAGLPREDNVGLYDVGDASFDITGLPAAHIGQLEGQTYGLIFELADGAGELIVSWGLPIGEARG